jgi:hypothetical protein
MEQAPKLEKGIDEMSIVELDQALETAQKRLEDVLIEVEKNPDQAIREGAKETAAMQFDAIIAMRERRGDLVRNRIEIIKEDEVPRDIPLDNLSENIKPVI